MKILIIVTCFIVSVTSMQMCPREDLQECIQLADPFIQDDKFVFPVTPMEIQTMCMAWDRLADCVRKFVLRCMSPDYQREFDFAVEESENTMQQMCHDVRYQAEYLENANCIKSVSVKHQRCGERYIKLVSEVATRLNYDALCCHFGKYRNCVMSYTAVDCSPAASKFARTLLDKSMGILLRKCRNETQTESIDECPSNNPEPNTNQQFNPNVNSNMNPNINPIYNQNLNPNLNSNVNPKIQNPQPNANPDSFGSGLNQVGNDQQQPSVLAPTLTPRPTARWTYDPQNIGGLEPESWLDYNSAVSLVGPNVIFTYAILFLLKSYLQY